MVKAPKSKTSRRLLSPASFGDAVRPVPIRTLRITRVTDLGLRIHGNTYACASVLREYLPTLRFAKRAGSDATVPLWMRGAAWWLEHDDDDVLANSVEELTDLCSNVPRVRVVYDTLEPSHEDRELANSAAAAGTTVVSEWRLLFWTCGTNVGVVDVDIHTRGYITAAAARNSTASDSLTEPRALA